MKKAIIIAATDAFANGVKPIELKKHLESNGFTVVLLPSSQSLRLCERGIFSKVPLIRPLHVFVYVTVLYALSRIVPSARVSRNLKSMIRIPLNKSYASTTYKRLKKLSPDLVICESNYDIGFTLYPRVAELQILDLPCPWAEELFYGNEINTATYEKFKEYEKSAYESSDALSFHWHTYANYVKLTKYKGDNFIDMGYGTNAKDKSSKFSSQPRIIFLGYMGGYWVNMKLLESISKVYPHIDVYGGPEPPKKMNLNYKGYAPNLDIIADYQFGLITISDDELRKNSFSSKHLEYISYGLPVFTPAWRKDSKLYSSSIYYNNEKDFLKQLERYSNRIQWNSKHELALQTVKGLSWTSTFVELDKIINDKGWLSE